MERDERVDLKFVTLAIETVNIKGVRKGGGLGLSPLSLIFYKNFITFAKEINCFRILFTCWFVDLMQIPRNKFACKFQGAS